MRLRSCETYWLLKNGLLNTYPSLREHTSCEILVIGSGITGSLMAHQFSSEGYNTMLIDKRDVSLGSTSATTGLLQYEIDEPLFSLIEKVGTEAAVNSYLGGVEAIRKLGGLVRSHKIDCGFETRNSLFIAHNSRSQNDLLKEHECRKEAGLDVKWLSATEIKDQYGVIGDGAILSTAAASTDGYQLAHGLLSHAITNYKLRIFDHTQIRSVNYGSVRHELITEGGFTIQCDKIVYATGYETQQVLDEKIVKLISTYACISEPLLNIPQYLSNTLFWDTEDPYLYVRSTQDGRILVGGEDESFVNPERRDALIDKKEMKLVNKLKKLMPALKIIPDFSWAGTFGVTKDALPYIGAHPEFPNCYFVLGFGGNGITFSVMGMEILSDAVAGRPNKFLEYFRFGR